MTNHKETIERLADLFQARAKIDAEIALTIGFVEAENTIAKDENPLPPRGGG